MTGKHLLFAACLAVACLPATAQQNAYSYKIKTIVLDAGHGGHDTGCQGAFSNEKDVTLAVALKIGALIKQTYPDIKVLYTRTTDKFIELYERADIANRNDADLFISIHCNANRSHDPYGTETWLMGLKKSEGNLEVSKRENDVVLLENNYQEHYNGFDPNSPEGYIILSMNQNAHLEQSIDLASKVEAQFKKEGRNSRGVKQAGFLVLWRTTMPSILIETGFLTNRNEEKYLNSAKGQDAIAAGVLNAITAYKNEVEENGGVVVSDAVAADDTNQADDKVPDTISSKDQASKDVADPVPASSSIIYRVQIVASSNHINLKESRYAAFKEIKNDRSASGMNRIVVGNYSNYDECLDALGQIRKRGFKDAFIVGYKDNKRIPPSQLP